MNKNNFIYKSATAVYLSLIHFMCDAKRKPLINKLKCSKLNLTRGGYRS